VTQVAGAGGAADLGAHHAVGGVGTQGDRLGVGGVVEGGPAAVGVELGGGAEQLGAAAAAAVDALAVLVEQGPGEGPLGAGLTQHVVLHGAQGGAPLGVGARGGLQVEDRAVEGRAGGLGGGRHGGVAAGVGTHGLIVTRPTTPGDLRSRSENSPIRRGVGHVAARLTWVPGPRAGRGAAGKVAVFGLLKGNGKVYTVAVPVGNRRVVYTTG